MKWIFVYIAIIAAVGGIIRFVKRRRNKAGSSDWWERAPFLTQFPNPLPHAYETPLGSRVNSQSPLDTTQIAVLQAIQDGVADYLRSTENKGYTHYRSHADFDFYLLSDWVTAADGKPALKIKLLDAWKGTQYDKGGYMLAAGLTIGLGDGLATRPLIFLPQCADTAFLRVISRYEPEHVGAYKNDRAFYDATSGQHTHPLYPDPEENTRGFYTPARTAFVSCIRPVK